MSWSSFLRASRKRSNSIAYTETQLAQKQGMAKLKRFRAFVRQFSYSYGIFVNTEMCCEVSTVPARERCCTWLKCLLHLSVQCCKNAIYLQKNLHHYCPCCYWKAIWDHFCFISGNSPSQAQLQPLGFCSDICRITGRKGLCALPEMSQQSCKITEHNKRSIKRSRLRISLRIRRKIELVKENRVLLFIFHQHTGTTSGIWVSVCQATYKYTVEANSSSEEITVFRIRRGGRWEKKQRELI